MAQVELIMPKMGESVAEATVIKWLKNVGDTIEMDESVLEIATDKVDSEIPSSIEGVLVKQLFKEDDVVLVGGAGVCGGVSCGRRRYCGGGGAVVVVVVEEECC